MLGKLKRVLFQRKKIIILIVLLAIVLGAALYAVQTLNKPAEGVVNLDFNQPQSEPVEIPKEFKSQYFISKYPSRYDLQANQNKSASLESWILIAHQVMGQGPGSKIGVSITKLPVGGVKEDSAYKQFEAFPNLYTLTKEAHQHEEIIVADRIDTNFEHTALWAHGGYLLTGSLTSGQKNAQLVTEFNVILDNWTWAQ